MNTKTAKFDIGQLVRHRALPLRGVIVDVTAQATDEEPVYHVLAEGLETRGAVVGEESLEADDDLSPLDNPAASAIFAGFARGRYRMNRRALN